MPGKNTNKTHTDADFEALDLVVAKWLKPWAAAGLLEVFAGRKSQIRRTVDAIFQSGLHVVVHGERGVGKTSLAMILQPYLEVLEEGGHIDAAPQVVKVHTNGDDTFASAWGKVLSRVRWNVDLKSVGFHGTTEASEVGTAAAFGALEDLNNTTIEEIVRRMEGYVVIFDEFDRLPEGPRRQFTDFIKVLQDEAINITVVMVGVSDTVEELVEDHASISRALRQVKMPRMARGELRQILETAEEHVGFEFTNEAKQLICVLAQGLPHFAHLFGLASARRAFGRRKLSVTIDDVNAGLKRCLQDADEIARRLYSSATHSPQTTAQWREVLLACAVAAANCDEEGWFRAADVQAPIESILGKPTKVAKFNGHLTKLLGDDRGPALQRTGKPRMYRYRLTDPLLGPFVIARGLQDGLIATSTLDELLNTSPSSDEG